MIISVYNIHTHYLHEIFSFQMKKNIYIKMMWFYGKFVFFGCQTLCVVYLKHMFYNHS